MRGNVSGRLGGKGSQNRPRGRWGIFGLLVLGGFSFRDGDTLMSLGLFCLPSGGWARAAKTEEVTPEKSGPIYPSHMFLAIGRAGCGGRWGPVPEKLF